MTTFLRMTPGAAAPETSRPAADRLVSGDPVHTTWNIEERGPVLSGLWRSTPGSWRIRYDEWEYCRILEGRSVLVGDDGNRHELAAGDSFILRPGFTGVWSVTETTVKEYVIVLPDAQP